MTKNKDNWAHRSVAITFAVLGIAAAGMSACSTVEGAGEDLSHVGESISGASQDVQDNND